MLFLATYDIEDNRLRTKVAEKLLSFGLERVQYSVFVGPLDEQQKEKFLTWVAQLLGNDTPDTNFLLLPLPQYSTAEALHIGPNPPDWDYLSGQKLTLFF